MSREPNSGAPSTVHHQRASNDAIFAIETSNGTSPHISFLLPDINWIMVSPRSSFGERLLATRPPAELFPRADLQSEKTVLFAFIGALLILYGLFLTMSLLAVQRVSPRCELCPDRVF
jgi:hypothetical protein